MWQAILFLSLFTSGLIAFGTRFAGPYEIKFQKLYFCDDVGEGRAVFSTKMRKLNRTHHVYTSNVTLDDGWSDDISVKFDVSVWGNGGWRNNFLNLYTERACTSGKIMLPGVGESLFRAAGYNFSSCPVPPGVYEVKRWVFNMHFAMNVVPYGRYMFTGRSYRTNKNKRKSMITCVVGELDVVPIAKY